MNDTQALYDLAPMLELMALGLVIALGPLAWVWCAAAAARRCGACRRSRCSRCS
jgi:cytochrome c oxidase assembly protein subunit 15